VIRYYFESFVSKIFITLKVLYRSFRDWSFKKWFLFWFTKNINRVKIWGIDYYVRNHTWRYKLSDIASIYGIEDYFICPVNNGDIVVDVGAYIGAYTLWAYNKGAQVKAHEPYHFNILEANIEYKNIDFTICAMVKKIDSNTLLKIYSKTSNPSESSLFYSSGKYSLCPHTTLKWDLECLDGHIDVLKMDCEGAEYDILFNSQDVLHKIDKIIMEYHVPRYWGIKNYTVKGLIEMLEKNGFMVTQKQKKCYQGIIYAKRY
jgi:FkbM family methyltransferase